jgi:hypothetical protein
MSAFYGGPAACLVVEKGGFYELRHGGKRRKLRVKLPATRPATTRPAPARTRKAA